MKGKHANEAQAAAARAARLEDELNAMRKTCADLAEAIAGGNVDALEPVIMERVRNAESTEIRTRLRNAYLTRDRAMVAFWRVSELHHSQLSGKCRCGKQIGSCSELQALEPFESDYAKWERHQIDLMNEDKPHGLPRDHPKAVAPSSYGTWRGAAVARPIAFRL